MYCTLSRYFAQFLSCYVYDAIVTRDALNAGHPFSMCAVDSFILSLCSKQNGSWCFGNHKERLYLVGRVCSRALITNFKMSSLMAEFCNAECETV